MAKTLYRVYGVQLPQEIPGAPGEAVDGATFVREAAEHKLIYMGQVEATNPRSAAREVVSEPRPDTEYVAIPERNITAVTPNFKPASVSWS